MFVSALFKYFIRAAIPKSVVLFLQRDVDNLSIGQNRDQEGVKKSASEYDLHPKKEGEKLVSRLRLRAEGGFTLLELLVVVAIIGILAAIAMPQISSYRRRGYDADAKASVKNASTAQEAYFVDKYTYAAALSDLKAKGFRQSPNIGMADPAATATDFVITATVLAGCSSGFGVWSFSNTSGVFTGLPCG